MSTENLAYRQERTSFIVYHIPSYIRAIRQNESDEFLKTLMAGFIARFPMDLLGLPQLGPLRLTEVDPKLQHPHEMVEVTVKGHLNVSGIFLLSLELLSIFLQYYRICEKNTLRKKTQPPLVFSLDMIPCFL